MRYLVFAGSDFYPYGGFQDFKAAFYDVYEAKEYLQINIDDYTPDCAWAHIICINDDEDKTYDIISIGRIPFNRDDPKWLWNDNGSF
jgi:hypothetical protein